MIADCFTMVLLLSVMTCQRGIKAITTTMLNSVLGDLAEIANLDPRAVCSPFDVLVLCLLSRYLGL